MNKGIPTYGLKMIRPALVFATESKQIFKNFVK